MRFLCFGLLAAGLLLSACGAKTIVPLTRQDLLSGKYRLLPKESSSPEEEVVVTVRRFNSGWILAVQGSEITLSDTSGDEEFNKSLFRSRDRGYSQCGGSSHHILCVTRPGAVIEGGTLTAGTGAFIMVLDRGAWELERIE